MADYDIGAAFEAIEDELMDSMVRNLKRHRAEEGKEGLEWSQWQAEQLAALEKFKRSNRRKYAGRFRSINSKLERIIRESYSDGQNDQEAAILDAILRGADLRRGSDALTGAFFRTNQRKLDALIKATLDDMEKAETAILRRTDDQYRKIIFNAQVYANSGAGTYEKAVDMATRDFLAAGIKCVTYSNGAVHTLADYADMALRTASKRAYLSGEGVKRQEWGVSTVIVNKRSNACPHCARFCGKVFIDDVWSAGRRGDGNYPLLSKAVEQGLYHPRCKDSHTTWFPELHEDAEPYTPEEIARLERAEARELRQQHARRQAEKYRRMEEHSLDPENQAKYRARAAAWEEISQQDVASGADFGALDIDEAAIAGIPVVTPRGWTKQQAESLCHAHQRLLRRAKRLQRGREAAAAYDENFDLILEVDGAMRSVDIDDERAHVIIHSHPSGLTFSRGDVNNFLQRPHIAVLTAVGNNGTVYMLQRTEHYVPILFLQAWRKEQEILVPMEEEAKRKPPDELTMQEYAAEMSRFLKGVGKYGIEYTEASINP